MDSINFVYLFTNNLYNRFYLSIQYLCICENLSPILLITRFFEYILKNSAYYFKDFLFQIHIEILFQYTV